MPYNLFPRQGPNNLIYSLTGSVPTIAIISLFNIHFPVLTFLSPYYVFQALELNSTDVNALVSRSKCYLLLGESQKALNDAEQALLSDNNNNIRAIYQKAESLYFLGQFEHSLMFFHRGLRLRPELNTFRLGVQKTQEAIENTIGVSSMAKPKAMAHNPSKSNNDSGVPNSAAASRISTARSTERNPHMAQLASSNPPCRSTGVKRPPAKVDSEKLASRRLMVDKEYLENLLKHPDLKRADTDSEQISALAKDAVNFLNNRQEFWRQQHPCTVMVKRKQRNENGGK